MTLQDFEFPAKWYEDEVREGFFVPATMKRNWAGQLKVLQAIDNACKQLGIHWYMYAGTLLGAVRHKGFIPWDDDMDIVMLRKDAEILRAHAAEVLPKGYLALDPRDNKDFESDVFRIAVSKNFDFSEEHMEQYHTPFVLGMDIFILDNYTADPDYEHPRNELYDALLLGRAYHQNLSMVTEEDYQTAIKKYEQKTGAHILGGENELNEICAQEMNVAMMYKDDTTKWVKGYFSTGYYFQREWFGVPQMVSFEGIDLPAPCNLDKVLFAYYGNQNYIAKGRSGHEYPYYEEQEEILRKELGHNYLRYTYDVNDLEVSKEEHPRVMATKLIDTIGKALTQMKLMVNDVAVRNSLLLGIQKLMTSLVDVLTPVFPNTPEVGAGVSGFVETVFQAFSGWQEDSADQMESACRELASVLEQAFSKRKEIVFLPCRAEWWESMKPLWTYACGLPDDSVRVCPIRWYEEPKLSVQGEAHDETDLFPAEVEMTLRDAIDLAAFHPEAIVIQVPYDNMGCFMMIDPENCSAQLKRWTDKLIYVPCFVPDTPKPEEGVSVKALENLIEQPAVMHADEVRVPTSRMRDIYIETLVELGGEDRRPYWEKKIKAEDRVELSLQDTVFSTN